MAAGLVLGDFIFQDMEVPEDIPFAGPQRLAINKMIGGVRDIQPMGPDWKPVSWSGTFFPTKQGQSALDRALILKQMADAAQPLNLFFDEISLVVFISSFDPDYRFYRIPYHITVEVLEDLTNPVSPDASPNIDDLVGADLSAADQLTSATGDSTLSGLIGNVKSAVGSVSTLVGASLSQVSTILQSVHAASTYVASAVGKVDTILASVGVPAGVLPSVPAVQNVAAFSSILSANGQQINYLQIGSLLGRMRTNLAQINSSGRTITVGGGHLFDIASKEYGDSTAWTQIAQANGLKDPQLSGITTLIIPPYKSGSTGILNQ